MTFSMSYVDFVSSIVYLFLAVFIFLRAPSSTLHRACACFLACFFLWSFGDVFLHDPRLPREWANFSLTVSSLGWIPLPLAFLWFSLAFSRGTKVLRPGVLLSVLSLPTVLFLLYHWTSGMVASLARGPVGWVAVWDVSGWTVAFFSYYLLYVAVGIVLVFRAGRVSGDPVERRSSVVIAVGSVAALAAGFFLNVIAPLSNLRFIPPVAGLVGLFWALVVAYVVVKYHFMAVTPARAVGSILSIMSDALVLLNSEGNLVDVNPAASEAMGEKKSELMGRAFETFLTDAATAREILDRSRRGETVKHRLVRFRFKEGREIPMLVSASPFLESGRFSGVVVVAADLAEELKAVNQQLSREIDERKRMEETTRSRSEWEGLMALISTYFLDLPPTDIDAGVEQALSLVGERCGAGRATIALFREDKRRVERVHGWGAPGVDLRRDDFHRIPLPPSPWLSGKLEKPEAFLIPSPGSLPPEAAAERKWLEERGVRSCAMVPLFNDGEAMGLFSFEWEGEVREFPPDIIVFMGIVSEIFSNALARQRIGRALAREKERLAVTLRSIGDGLIGVDPEGRVVLMNTVAEQLTGWKVRDAKRKKVGDVFILREEPGSETVEAAVAKVLSSRERIDFNRSRTLAGLDGRQRKVEASVTPMEGGGDDRSGAILVFRDVTERERMQDDLQKTQRLESLGLLAGGIAHDFNNLLAVILGNFSILKRYDALPGDVLAIVNNVEESCWRAQDLTRQLLTFSKGGAPVKGRASVGQIVRETTDFLLRGSNVKGQFSIQGGLWSIEVDAGQISQAIQNLVMNAVESMPRGGVLKVGAENVRVDEGSPLSLAPGPFIKIRIADEGPGIPRDLLGHIFDPYFTTKKEGKGIGLSVVYSVVKRHGGHVEVEETSERGTAFAVYLPVQGGDPASPFFGEEELPPAEGRGGRRGKILVMDDDRMICHSLEGLLSGAGYVVETALDGAEAVEKFRLAQGGGRPFDVVVLDLVIPGGPGGEETLKELHRLFPAVKAIALSGYSTNDVMNRFQEFGFKERLAKPYRVEDLMEKIDRLVARENPGESSRRGG